VIVLGASEVLGSSGLKSVRNHTRLRDGNLPVGQLMWRSSLAATVAVSFFIGVELDVDGIHDMILSLTFRLPLQCLRL
jgi:hypothetical protein